MDIVFDKFYEDYDSWYSTAVGTFVDRMETDCALELLQPAPGQRVLDVGCGTGNFSLKLAALGCRVTGVDIAEKMLEQARAKAAAQGAEVELLLQDAASLPFADGSFDRVLSMAAFEFLHDPAAVIAELLRVLRPGGILVVGTIEQGGPWAELYASDACRGTAYEQARFLTGEQVAALGGDAAAAVSRCLYVPPMLPDAAYTPDQEQHRRQQGEKGGFVCVQFRKK